MNYAKLAFTDTIKLFQEEYGSRRGYDQMEKMNQKDGLTENEIGFIEYQDHFYMASIGKNGYPYIQHRGGPEGFVKVLDNKTLAFLDFTGNKQYISIGNIKDNPNVALIMVSYPHRARLKIYAKAKTATIAENPDLFSKIDLKAYKHKPERIIILEVQAYDWNCPQHIVPRYTVQEIEAMFAKHKEYVEKLEAENAYLKSQQKT